MRCQKTRVFTKIVTMSTTTTDEEIGKQLVAKNIQDMLKIPTACS